MRPARSIRGASRSRSPGFRAGTTRRAIGVCGPCRREAEEAYPPRRQSVTPAPAHPCGGCEREPRNRPEPCFVTTRPSPASANGAPDGRGVEFRVGQFRRASGGQSGPVAKEGRRVRPRSRSAYPRLIRGIARDWFSGAGGVTCRRECIGSSRVPRSGSHHTTSTIGLGGTIPSAPLVSTGKPLATRCHSRVDRTRCAPTGSGELAARECARQGLQPRALRGKSAQALRHAIRCDCASSALREGSVKEERRKIADVRKKKMPPPVPCGSSFGNPLIEKGASRVSFGSHYNLVDERRGWACERPEY